MVLPAPDGPTSATISPGSATKLDVVEHLDVVAGLDAGHRLQ